MKHFPKCFPHAAHSPGIELTLQLSDYPPFYSHGEEHNGECLAWKPWELLLTARRKRREARTQPLRAKAAAKEAEAVNVTWQDPGVCSEILSSVFKFGSTEVNSVLPGDFTRHLAGVCIITCLSELGVGSEKQSRKMYTGFQVGTDSTSDVRDSQYVCSCFKTKYFSLCFHVDEECRLCYRCFY